MDGWKKPVFEKYTRKELGALRVHPPDRAVYEAVLGQWDRIAKPLDGLGRFEKMTARIGAISGSYRFDISPKAVIIFCADNGIVEEGVSQSSQKVTAAVAGRMGRGESAVGKMASQNGVTTLPVDIGINGQGGIEGLLDRKIRRGTRNFLREPAMTEEETVGAVSVGIDLAYDCKAAGYKLLAVGEMGIGNTTTASAVTAALLGCPVEEVTGRGAGLDDESLLRKRRIIRDALEKYRLTEAEPLDVLCTVGGLDIAGMAGVCLGGALCGLPVVLDGVISLSAALLAERIAPGTSEYLLPSHRGKEPAAGRLLDALGLEPVIYGEMALGEGTGAVMLFALLDTVMPVYREGLDFADLQIAPYERYEKC